MRSRGRVKRMLLWLSLLHPWGTGPSYREGAIRANIGRSEVNLPPIFISTLTLLDFPHLLLTALRFPNHSMWLHSADGHNPINRFFMRMAGTSAHTLCTYKVLEYNKSCETKPPIQGWSLTPRSLSLLSGPADLVPRPRRSGSHAYSAMAR